MTSEAPPHGIADGQLPTYRYQLNQGYVMPESSQILADEGTALTVRNAAGSHDPNSDLSSNEDFASDVGEEDLNSANPADYTKAYNRQRRLNAAVFNSSATKSSYPKANPQRPTANTLAFVDDNDISLSKHAANLKLDAAQSGFSKPGPKGLEKSDRATLASVLDRRTLAVLRKLINRNVVSKIDGIIATGKEAHVFHAVSTPEGTDVVLSRAIKVYKTSILTFKDRDKYVSGGHRYRSGYDKTSNRAIVEEWALKEFRNLKRIHAAGIPCPEPIEVRQNVLAMEFLGEPDSVSARRLKDVEFDDTDAEKRWSAVYFTILAYMRKLYQVCKLVHADLSEYNILFYQDRPWIIDVSQSVEHDHFRSSEFLRMDIKNVNDFFQRKGVRPLGEERSFEYIRRVVKDASFELDAMHTEIETEQEKADAFDEIPGEVDVQVFRQRHIPRTLEEVPDAEEDAEKMKQPNGDGSAYRHLLARTEPQVTNEVFNASDDGSEIEERSSNGSGSESEESNKPPRGKRFQDRDAKKEHKQKVKEEKRDQRARKIPKHEKKKLIRQSARHKK